MKKEGSKSEGEKGERRCFDLEDRFINLAAEICKIAESIPRTRTGNHVANQLIRSGTAPASNYGEAQGAESRRDFIHKLKICLKELRETMVWMKFLERINYSGNEQFGHIISEVNELIAIIVKSIATAQKNVLKNS